MIPSASATPIIRPPAARPGDPGERFEPARSRAPSSRTERSSVGSSTASRTASAALGPDRAGGEGRAVVAGLQRLGRRRPGDAGADRHPVAERLGAGDHVGPHRRLLVGPERAGPPDPGLDLVEDQQRPDLVAGLPRREQRLVGGRPDARTRPGSARSAPPRCSARPRRAAPRRRCRGPRRKPGSIGPERLVAGQLRRRREGPVGAPVELAFEADDPPAPRSRPRGRARGLSPRPPPRRPWSPTLQKKTRPPRLT